ncbi:hypothetical protein DKE45_019525 (plasmid) [Acinetobacter pittii]|nr:hypothetical protein DKE45_019525 [Acinetobacter pittii]
MSNVNRLKALHPQTNLLDSNPTALDTFTSRLQALDTFASLNRTLSLQRTKMAGISADDRSA